MPAATADHSIDEHWVDPPIVSAGNVTAGVGFTIYGKTPDIWVGNTSSEPSPWGTRNYMYGLWTVAWCWN